MTPKELRAFLFELPQHATIRELRAALFAEDEQEKPVNNGNIIHSLRRMGVEQ